MSLTIQTVCSFSAALCAAVVAHSLLSWFLTRRPSLTRSLQDFAYSPSSSPVPEVPIGSMEYRIGLAFAGSGINVTGRERFMLNLAIGILGIGLAAGAASLDLPPLFWLISPAVAYFTVNSLVNKKWNQVRMAIEKEIPSFLMNLSSMVQLTPNVLQALEDAALSLNPQAPLRPWVGRLVHSLQSRGRQGLEEMQAEAGVISPSLLLSVVEIGRLWETGGTGFTRSFQLVSENLSGILEGRSKAFSKADGAWGTIRVIVLALGAAIFLAFSSPGSSALFRTPLSQVAMVVALGWAVFGFSYINDLIRESVE